jgi:hypothetical protein
MMEWVLAPMSSLLVVILVIPAIVVVGVLLLLRAVGHAFPVNPTLSRVTFNCPFSKRKATVDFLVPPGSGQPSDVLSCSVFPKPYHVGCEKGCLGLAQTGWTASLMMPRFALLADGVGYRPAARPVDSDGESPNEEA